MLSVISVHSLSKSSIHHAARSMLIRFVPLFCGTSQYIKYLYFRQHQTYALGLWYSKRYPKIICVGYA